VCLLQFANLDHQLDDMPRQLGLFERRETLVLTAFAYENAARRMNTRPHTLVDSSRPKNTFKAS
jgi:hypothetical protein